jgi:putative DNA primase/helicase
VACDVVPGHLFTAPKQGSGKSLLVDVASAIATGERAYAILAHKQPEEQDKQLTGAVLEGRQIIALDNLTGEIESAVLAQITERERVSARPLGTSQTIPILNSFNTYLTGNNATVAGDNTRRIVVGRIDPQVENPLDRRFERTNPVTRVLQDRGTYAAAGLTIVLAHIAQGRPCRLPPTPSYEAWSELVREPLVWLGLPDPTNSMRAAFDDDPGNAQLAALMAAWPIGQTDWTAAELIEAALKADAHGPVHPGLAEALKPIARDRRGMLDAVVLGNQLRLNRDKIVGGRKISRHTTSLHGGFARWVLK